MNILSREGSPPHERWKNINGFEDYQVSNYGRVGSKKKGWMLLCIKHSPRHYPSVCLSDGRLRNYIMCHRLVAEHFLEDWNRLLQVDHIDGDKYNCSHLNLRMVTDAQNKKGFRKAGAGSSRFRGVSWNKKDKRWCAFIKENRKTKYIGSFPSEEEAALSWNAEALKRGFKRESLNVLS